MDDVRARLRRASTASSSASAASRGRRERLRRSPSAASAASAGRASSTSTSRGSAQPSEFDAFLSDSSSDEDEEDADARVIARMQQQADDMTYVPDRAGSLLFRIDSPNGLRPAAGFLPDQVKEEEEEEEEDDASFAGSDVRSSVEDAWDSADDLSVSVGPGDDRVRASDEQLDGSDMEEGGDYIQENDESFVAVNRPVYDDDDDDDSDEGDQAGRQRQGQRNTSAFEVAASNANIDGEEEEEEGRDEQATGAAGEADACMTVTIVETPTVPSVVDAQREDSREQEESVEAAFVEHADKRDSSFSGMASPAQDPCLRVNDSFIGGRRSSADSSDKSFLEEKPRPTFGSAGAASFSDPFLRVNDSFIGDRRGSADSADKSFLEDKPRPTHGSAGGGSFSEDIDASFRLDGYGDSFGSMRSDSYAADHAPYSDSYPSERIGDDIVPSAGNESSLSGSKSGDRDICRQHQDGTKSSFESADTRRIQASEQGSDPIEVSRVDVDSIAPLAVLDTTVSSQDDGSNEARLSLTTKPTSSPEAVDDKVSRDDEIISMRDTGAISPSFDDTSMEMEQTRFSRVPSSVPRDSGRLVDFRDTQHQFDEEEVQMHHTGPLSPLYQCGESTEDEDATAVPGFRENSFSNSLSSSASSFTNKEGNFFVGSNRGSDAESYSNSISDSFASVVIMGDTVLDANNSFVDASRRSDVSMRDENSEKLDRSYSNLIDSKMASGQDTANHQRASRSSASESVLSLSSASASSAATDDELSFASFNGGRPPAAASSERLSSKSNGSGAFDRPQSSSPSFFLRDSNATVRHADSLVNGQRSSTRFSRVADPSRSSAGSFVDASFTSSIDDSRIYPDARARGDTRSDEIEAGDVAQGVLPSLPPPLKIGIATASPATSAPLALSSSFGSFAESDVVRNTDDKLDFTGVYRGSVNSLESSRVAGDQTAPSAPPPTEVSPAPERSETDAPPASFSNSAVRLSHLVSDNVQRESQRKVEDFFRRTYEYQKGDNDIDDIDDDIRRTTRNRATRSRTTVIYCVDENEEERGHANRNRSSTIATTKIIDLKHLKGGQKLYQKVLTPQRESENIGPYIAEKTPPGTQGRRGSRFYSNDLTGDVIEPSSMETPADTSYYANLGKDANGMKLLEAACGAASAAHTSSGYGSIAASSTDNSSTFASVVQYGLSPKSNDSQAKSSGFFAATAPSVRHVGAPGAFGGNRRADNASLTSLTPSQPRISMDSSSFAPSPYTVAMLTKSPGMAKWQQEHANARDLGVSPGSSVGVKESLFRPTGLSRPTFSEQVASHVHQFSSSLTDTIRRAGAALLGQSAVKQHGDNDPTSPQSTCPAPPRLARGFDDREFYSRFAQRGGVENPHDPPVKPTAPLSARQRKRRNAQVLRMALAAIVGLLLGIVLTQVGGLSSVFNLDASQVHEKQAHNGELVLSVATQWMLLPGRLFLRVWNCVTIPLLFCHAANGVADVVMGEKESLLLGFRTFGVMLLIATIATLEGIAAMAITNSAGWFQASDAMKVSTLSAAQSLEQSLGTSVYADGAVGLVCSSNHEYLQQLGSDQFNCSNASIVLPVYSGASGNGTIKGSGSAIFALQDVTSALSTMESNASAASARYYPEGLSVSDAIEGLFVTSVPSNSALSFVQSSPLSVVAFAVIAGLFCGKRALRRLLAIKTALDSSTRSYNTRTAMAAEQNARQPHYVLGVLVELQLALEWILVKLELYIAPIGVLSLLAGNMVAHFKEWHTIVAPMTQLIVGVFVLSLVHVIVVMPLFMKVYFKTNVFKTVLVHFVPSFLFAFCSGSVSLTSPVTVRCFADARIVTKSVSQVMATMTSVLHRSGHALYFPLALLWLMETNTLSANASVLNFDGPSYLLITFLILCSCFAALSPSSIVASGITSRGNLATMMTLWRTVVSHSAGDPSAVTAVPMTFPLLVICDVILSRVVDVVNVYGGVMVTLIVADHCDEVVVDASAAGAVSNSFLSPVYL